MQITCPKGCHQLEIFSFSRGYTEIYEEGEIFEVCIGEACDRCGSPINMWEPENNYRMKCDIRGALIGVVVGMIIAFLAKWLTQ